jgi:hypothetical protein
MLATASVVENIASRTGPGVSADIAAWSNYGISRYRESSCNYEWDERACLSENRRSVFATCDMNFAAMSMEVEM